MRGSERPSKVAWTHPFLQPLQPFSDNAATQTFIDITDGHSDNEEMEQLLSFTDNMPLAVDLIAHLADYEGCANVLARWKTEKTSLLSTGNDRKSNVDASIRISLSSPRITSGAKDLLSLLSILPDGLSDVELLQSNLPIKNIRSCKTTLIATSLAYIDNKKRLRSLMPIREHIQKFFHPSQFVMDPIRKHFHSLLDLYKKYNGAQLSSIVSQLTLNLGNLHQILYRGLHKDNPDVADNIHCIINLNSFHRVTGRTNTALMDQIPAVLSQLGNYRLEVNFITDLLRGDRINPTTHLDLELLIAQGISHCNHINDPVLECESNINFTWVFLMPLVIPAKFYLTAGYHHFYCGGNRHMAFELLERALKVSRSCGDSETQCSALLYISEIERSTGDIGIAQMHLHEVRRLANLSANLYQEARAFGVAAQCARHLGDCQTTIHHLQRATEILDICGLAGSRQESIIKECEAEIHLLKSEYTEASSIHTQTLQLTDQDPLMNACTRLNIAQIDVMLGTDAEEVQQNLKEAKTIFSTTKYFYGVSGCDMVFADLRLREGDTSSASMLFQQTLKSIWGRENGMVSFMLERLANRTCWQIVECTLRWPVVYLGHAQQSKEKLAVHKALLFIGDVFISQGEDETANSLFTVALEGFIYMDVHHSRAQCLLRLGDLANRRGDFSHATALWMAARPLFERSSQAKDVASIDARLAELEDNERVFVHLATLHPPESNFTVPSVEVEKAGIEKGKGLPGQNSTGGVIFSAI
jgi:tetratricopeptide (TPR) repeat protein